MYNVSDIRKQFPILERKVNGNDLIYFDNGATTHKPIQVIKTIEEFYRNYNSNIHRGVHTLSREATDLFEHARKKTAAFIGAGIKDIVFTSGTTHGINLVAFGIKWNKGDEIILTQMEHHSNILPWQQVSKRYGVNIKVLPVNQDGTLQIESLEGLITENTRLVSFVHVSNTLGTINPASEIIYRIKNVNSNVLVFLDGAQSVPHQAINVKELGCDFFAFSGHKVYGPTGIGVLYVNPDIQEKLEVSFSGGGTIKTVSFEQTDYAEFPLRLEPGTPNIEGAVGLASAIDFVEQVGIGAIRLHEHSMLEQLQLKITELPEIEIYANHLNKAAVISFNVKKNHPFDVGTLLDKYGIAVRTGHHCTQPLMQFYGIAGTVRVSLGVYNTVDELEKFMVALKKTIKMLN